jgi:hypothetical protein
MVGITDRSGRRRFTRDAAGQVIAATDALVAPFGNRTGHPTGRFPHYHRRGVQGYGARSPRSDRSASA